MKKKIIAPCGIDCFNCEAYEHNVTKEFRKRISSLVKIPKNEVSCRGCIEGNQCLFLDLQGKKCKTLKCVEQKGVDYCFQCDVFPCSYLMPIADKADKFPQNIKVYNLCLMKRIGIDAFIKQSSKIRETYFNKELSIGDGGCK